MMIESFEHNEAWDNEIIKIHISYSLELVQLL